jgi:hypothetical protein
MLQVLILICSTNISPADCQTETALDIVHGPKIASIMGCGLEAQALLAKTTLLRSPNEYAKINCRPRERAMKTAQKG